MDLTRERFDLVVVGAGPTGLAIGLEAKAIGLSYLLIDKGTVVNTIVGYPLNMTFFSTPELLELGDMPFTTPGARPTRIEAIEYYRGVARAGRLSLSLHNPVHSVNRIDDGFRVVTTKGVVLAGNVVIATGYFDNPNPFDVPGGDLDKVHRYYREPYPFFDQDVLVVGGRNSAVEAALDLWRGGARVTLVHRGDELSRKVKYWILPDIQNRIRSGQIVAYMNTLVEAITPRRVILRNSVSGERAELPNDAVFPLIGYRPDIRLLSECGVRFDPETLVPEHDPLTFQTNVPGLYVAGSVGCGCKTWEIFIENGRQHARIVVEAIASSRLAGA